MTFAEQGLDLGRRVYYTLTSDDPRSNEPVPVPTHEGALTQAKTAKLLACLLVRLKEKGIIDDSDVDDLLFEVVT
jgi:hypothetical protein